MKWVLILAIGLLASNLQAQDVNWKFDQRRKALPVKEKVVQKYPYVVPEVTTPQPFRVQYVSTAIREHGAHYCPECGFQSTKGGTWAIRGYDGDKHIHECPRCRTRWKH